MVQFVETNSSLWSRGSRGFRDTVCSGSAVRVPEASPGRPHQTRTNEGRKIDITKYENINFIGLYGVGVARRTCILHNAKVLSSNLSGGMSCFANLHIDCLFLAILPLGL